MYLLLFDPYIKAWGEQNKLFTATTSGLFIGLYCFHHPFHCLFCKRKEHHNGSENIGEFGLS